MARSWYAYDGMGNPFLTSSYNFTFIKPVCLHGCKICAIYATGTGVAPSLISGNLRSYIINMMVFPIAQPTDTAGTKIYLYGKNC